MGWSASGSRSRLIAGVITGVLVVGLAATAATGRALAASSMVAETLKSDEAVAAYVPSHRTRIDRYSDGSRESKRSVSIPTAYVAVAIARLLSESNNEPLADIAPGELASLREFYVRRGFTPTWIDGSGLNTKAEELLAKFGDAAGEGLDPADYIPATALASAPATAAALAELEIRLSASLERYTRDLQQVQVAPDRVDRESATVGEAPEVVPAPGEAAATDRWGADPSAAAPANPRLDQLGQALLEYRARAAAGGWPTPAPDRLEPGSEGDSVVLLRKILRATGDLRENPAGVAAPALYDDAVTTAVKGFQTRHGLEPDGVVGRETRLAMGVPVEARIRQILLNMERLRRLPEDLGDPHILVNVAGFKLDYVENGREVFEMRTIVGKPERSTPEFSGLITYLEINPTWTVPRTIAVEDLLPRFSDNPGYLAAKGYSVFARGGGMVDPAAIDWNAALAAGFPYWLRQKPGPGNALGRVKFMFPNAFDVYLHDTPSRGLFSQQTRAFSSGCIRVEQPLKLAVKLLEANGGWSEERVRAAIASGATRAVTLSRPVPVHLAYLTAWRGADGAVHFRDDIYGRDRTLEASLEAQAVELARAGGEGALLEP